MRCVDEWICVTCFSCVYFFCFRFRQMIHAHKSVVIRTTSHYNESCAQFNGHVTCFIAFITIQNMHVIINSVIDVSHRRSDWLLLVARFPLSKLDTWDLTQVAGKVSVFDLIFGILCDAFFNMICRFEILQLICCNLI